MIFNKNASTLYTYVLEYGFCKKLLLYECNSDPLPIKIRFFCNQNRFFTLSECLSDVLITGKSNIDEKSGQLVRVALVQQRYSEKAIKIRPTFHSFFDLTQQRQIISGRWANFLAFSEYLNFYEVISYKIHILGFLVKIFSLIHNFISLAPVWSALIMHI